MYAETWNGILVISYGDILDAFPQILMLTYGVLTTSMHVAVFIGPCSMILCVMNDILVQFTSSTK